MAKFSLFCCFPSFLFFFLTSLPKSSLLVSGGGCLPRPQAIQGADIDVDAGRYKRLECQRQRWGKSPQSDSADNVVVKFFSSAEEEEEYLQGRVSLIKTTLPQPLRLALICERLGAPAVEARDLPKPPAQCRFRSPEN